MRYNAVMTMIMLALAIAGLSLNAGAAEEKPGEFKYVGKRNCRSCHSSKAVGGVEYRIWEKSPHAGAWETLKTEEAKKVAAGLGIDKPEESPACLSCHSTAYDVDEKLKDENTHPSHGVTCEACHGPGSAYKDFKVMKNPELARKLGLNPRPDEELCKSCHNDKSPTFKGFNFKEAAAKIYHGKKSQN